MSCTLNAFHHCHSQRAECRVWDLELAPCVERCSRGAWHIMTDEQVACSQLMHVFHDCGASTQACNQLHRVARTKVRRAEEPGEREDVLSIGGVHFNPAVGTRGRHQV